MRQPAQLGMGSGKLVLTKLGCGNIANNATVSSQHIPFGKDRTSADAGITWLAVGAAPPNREFMEGAARLSCCVKLAPILIRHRDAIRIPQGIADANGMIEPAIVAAGGWHDGSK